MALMSEDAEEQLFLDIWYTNYPDLYHTIYDMLTDRDDSVPFADDMCEALMLQFPSKYHTIMKQMAKQEVDMGYDWTP